MLLAKKIMKMNVSVVAVAVPVEVDTSVVPDVVVKDTNVVVEETAVVIAPVEIDAHSVEEDKDTNIVQAPTVVARNVSAESEEIVHEEDKEVVKTMKKELVETNETATKENEQPKRSASSSSAAEVVRDVGCVEGSDTVDEVPSVKVPDA